MVKNKRLISLLLALMLFLSAVPVNAFESSAPFKVNYTATEEGALSTSILQGNNRVFIVNCAAGTNKIYLYYPSSNNGGSAVYANDNYIIADSALIDGFNSNLYSNGWYEIDLEKFTGTSGSLGNFTVDYSLLDKNCKYYAVNIINLEMEKLYHLVVQVGETSAGSDKAELRRIIDESSAYALDKDTKYYHADDRWNGRDKSSVGFWLDMKTALDGAKLVYDNNTLSQAVVDDTIEKMQKAIDGLIPSSYVNATELYEEINTLPKKPLLYSDYTKAAWNLYNAELDKAKNLLNSLYDGDGKPTEKNKSSDTELVSEIKAEIDALKNIKLSMDPLLDFDDTNDAHLKYDSLGNLLKTYNPAKYNQNLYTAESWSAFLDARMSVEKYISSNSSPGEEVGKREYDDLNRLYDKLWRGIHGLEDKKDSITITIKVVDTLGVRLGKALNSKSGIHTKTLNGDKTLNTAIDKLENEVLSSPNFLYEFNEYLYTTSINGILTTKPYNRGITPLNFKSPERNAEEKSYYSVQLHDGDIITLAFLEQPVVASSSGTGKDPIEERLFQSFYKQADILQNSEIVKDIIEVNEGQELELSAIYTLPHISTYSVRKNPLAGATVFVSDVGDTEEDISPASTNTGIVTGQGGEFTYAFYSTGYYALSVHDLRANNLKGGSVPGLILGDTIYVHVNGITAEQLKEAKLKFKNELTALYGAYPESFFTSSDWTNIKNFYETGNSSIDAAERLEFAKTAYDNALKGIKTIHDKTVVDNTSKMDGFRAILSRLPNDASLLGKSNALLVEELIKRHDAMSSYQKNQLTGMEASKYSAVKEAYDKGLPELEPYKLKLEIKADSPSAKAAIENMIGYVTDHGENTDLFYNFKIAERNIDGIARKSAISSRTYTDIMPEGVITTPSSIAGYKTTPSAISAIFSKAYPDNYIRFAPILDIFTYSFGKDIIVDNWEILNDAVIEQNKLVKGRTIRIGKIPYEIKKIEVSGVENINIEKDSVKISSNKSIEFPNAYRSFVMPYEDVTVTVTWGIVDENVDPGDNQELALAKTNAIAEIKNAYSKYKSNEYTYESWAELVDAKNKGLDEIAAAKSTDAVTIARNKAIDAMAAVAKKVVIGDIPDFGKKLGKVDVYVENTTFRGGAFTGTILSEPGFDYAEKDTMMTIILRALAESGYGWTGQGGKASGGANDYTIEYIATINKDGKSMGEFSGEPGSGWMGTLNDFFVNEGFQHFKVSDGDEIRVMFTQNLGVDLGGTWGNSDTSLSDLKLSAGKLYAPFSSNINDYTLVLPSGTNKLKVTPTAANKNYLVKTFLNDKVTSKTEGTSFYKRTQYIPVRPGNYINIGVGEYAWPSMNNQETEARNYSGTWYKLNIITPDTGASHVISLINTLPSVKNIALSHADKLKNIRDVYEVLTSSEKSKVTNLQKLTDAENRIAFFKEIEAVKVLLKKIPYASKVTLDDKTSVMSADAAYKNLTDEQKLYITVGDVKNYNDAIDKLTELGAFKAGGSPSKIKGNDAAPIIEGKTVDITAETKVVNGVSSSKVTENQINDIIKEIKDSDISSITINVATEDKISKSTVEIPKISLSNISKEKLDLNIQTPIGRMEIPYKALEEMTKQATGNTVEIVIENMKEEKLTQEQKTAVGKNTIYNISIISNGKEISSFNGQQITISLPYTLKEGQVSDKVSVWYLNDKGKLEKIPCKYDEATKLVTFTTDHLSYYIVGYDNSISFVDVNEKDWFYKSVMYVVQKGLFTGTDETRFSPNLPMTRAMLVTVLHRLDGKSSAASANRFTDVTGSEWYSDAIRWSSEKDIVRGVTDTEFMPQKNITREQLAVMLYRYAKIKGMNTEVKGDTTAFTDRENISSWAVEAMNWAVTNKLITGRENGMLDPSGNATRAEVAAILERFITKIIK